MRATVTITTEVQLDGIKSHGGRQVDPPPSTATSIAGPESPAELVAIGNSKVLQEQTGVYRNQNRRRKPAEETKNTVGAIAFVERGLFHNSLSTQLSNSRNNSRSAIENDGAICQRDDDARGDGLECRVEKLE